MRSSLLVVFLLFIPLILAAQNGAIPSGIRASHILDRLSSHSGLLGSDLIDGIPLPPGRVIGDTYLNPYPNKSTILLYQTTKLIEGYAIRYDIKRNELEFQTNNGLKVMLGPKVKSFLWIDSVTHAPGYFVNTKEFHSAVNPAPEGFMEVLVDGKMSLLKHTYIVVKKADYSIHFDVGSRDDKILKKNTFYGLINGELQELPSSKKKFLLLFSQKANEVEQFIKVNQLNVSSQQDLVRIFEYCNTLL